MHYPVMPVSDALGNRAGREYLYQQPASLVDLLPWREYLERDAVFLLEDGRSVAAGFRVTPVATEAASVAALLTLRDGVQQVLSHTLPELDAGAWIVQCYAYDTLSVSSQADAIARYHTAQHATGAFSTAHQQIMQAHLATLGGSAAAFVDHRVTDGPWRARQRELRLFVYRRWPASYRHPAGLTPTQELREVSARLTDGLAALGIATTPLTGRAFCAWLTRWFNPNTPVPNPAVRSGPPNQCLPYGADFAAQLFLNWPRAEAKTQSWWFDGRPHRCVSVAGFQRAPAIGHLSGEQARGGHRYVLFDRLPPGTVMALTMVVEPQATLESRLARLHRRAVGEGLAATQARDAVAAARVELLREQKLFRGHLAFFIQGQDLDELRQHAQAVSTLLLAHDLQPIAARDDPIGLNNYLLNLPMVYDPGLDRGAKRARFIWCQHLANLLPVYGRARGTGRPGLTFFNRGGEPLCFDPLSLDDRAKNGHLLLLGPTGAGKSATLLSLLCQMVSLYRPRLVIVEVGNSFGLFTDYLATHGLSVHRLRLAPGAGVSVPPFADAVRLSPPLSAAGTRSNTASERDLLGELELIAVLMITGGEAKEAARLTRADRRLIRDALLGAGAMVRRSGRDQAQTEDVVQALRARATDCGADPARQARCREMADALALFCDGLEGELFNRPGAVWPDADVTLVDLATLAGEGYGAQLAVAYTAVLNAVQARIERDQTSERPTLMVTDEGHLITTHPLLAPYVVKVVKLWRKLGAWYWIATQNLEDFPDAAKRMLNMLEWWLCLVMPPEEIEQIARFKTLTDEQKALLRSTRKQPGDYTEGVVLSDNVQALFRQVPPPLHLALAMTEQSEKAERQRRQAATGCTALEAAQAMAAEIATRRGA